MGDLFVEEEDAGVVDLTPSGVKNGSIGEHDSTRSSFRTCCTFYLFKQTIEGHKLSFGSYLYIIVEASTYALQNSTYRQVQYVLQYLELILFAKKKIKSEKAKLPLVIGCTVRQVGLLSTLAPTLSLVSLCIQIHTTVQYS